MSSFLFIVAAFLCGALPFSVWLGKLFVGLDVRTLGDGNPGAANAFRTGNRLVGLFSLLLDGSSTTIQDFLFFIPISKHVQALF